MAGSAVIGEILKAFQIALNAHDRENPTHTAHGIGMAHFDMDRLGFEEGEEILPGITMSADGGTSGNFRVLCDGQHDEQEEAEEVEAVEAVSRELVPLRVGGEERDDLRTMRAGLVPPSAPRRSSDPSRLPSTGPWKSSANASSCSRSTIGSPASSRSRATGTGAASPIS